MRITYNFIRLGLALLAVLALTSLRQAAAQEESTTKEIRASADRLSKSFNAGKVDELVALFLPTGELVDDEGVVYQGPKELKKLFTRFFEKFPGAQLTFEIESVRPISSNLAIEEGSRHITAKQDGAKVDLRYLTVRTKVNGQWLIASVREFANDAPPTPQDRLKSLAWLVGEWVNEGDDGVVKISYRWSEDKNFLLANFDIIARGKPGMKSVQRIGWDPLAQKVRSWLFDSDGGFAEGHWTQVDDRWIVKSMAVMPDGETGSATITYVPNDKDHFTIKGSDRIVGDSREDDFEVTVTRQPPKAAAVR